MIHNGHAVEAEFEGLSPGPHTLELWRLDDNAVLQWIELHPLAR